MKTHIVPIKLFALVLTAVMVATGCLLMPCPAFAAPGDLDLSFDAGSGVDVEYGWPVSSMVLQPDGKILIAGEFRTVKGFVKNGIARLNPDGSNDTSFNASTGPNGYVQSLGLQPDGKILIGGGFDYVNGVSRTNIARLNADGTLDTSFNPVTELNGMYNGTVGSFAVQSDGKVLIAGNFTKVNGVSRNGMARLNIDGSLDTSFNPGTIAANGSGPIVLQPDGKVLLGIYEGFVRLNTNGSRDTTFNVVVSGVYSIALQPDGKLLIGGGFSDVNGVQHPTCARLNADGSLDMSFGDQAASPGFANVRSIALQSDGKVLIGGVFSTVQRTTRLGIARLNADDGTLDGSFDPTVLLRDSLGYGRIRLVALQADGKVLITGEFKTVNGVSRYGMARLNSDASLDPSFNSGSGPDGAVVAMAAQSDGKVLIGGWFDGVGGLVRSRLARLNANGSVDPSFDSQLFPYPSSPSDPAIFVDPVVTAITVQPDGKMLVGSSGYGQAGTGFKSDLGRLNADGSADSSFNAVHGEHGDRASGPVCIALQTDGKVIIGGAFDSLNGTAIKRIARLNDDGNLDFSFSADVSGGGGVYAIAVQLNGKVIIGGGFTTVNSVGRTNLARLNDDGSLDTSFDPTNGVRGTVVSIVLQPDGKVLIGSDWLARLNADGRLDTSFNVDSSVSGGGPIVLQPDGRVLLGGSVNGITWSPIVRLNADGSLDTTFNTGNGADHGASCMALQPDGRLLIGGGFSSVNGFARNYVARLFGGDPAILHFQPLGSQLVLSWTNTGFNLQSAPAVTGPFTNLPAATSPYTNPFTAPQQFFRLVAP